jgi:hypothetical protein
VRAGVAHSDARPIDPSAGLQPVLGGGPFGRGPAAAGEDLRGGGADGGEGHQRLARIQPGGLERGDVPVAAVLAQHVDGVPEHQVRFAGPGEVGVGGGERAPGGACCQRGFPGQLRRFGQLGRIDQAAKQCPVHLVDRPLPRRQELRRRGDRPRGGHMGGYRARAEAITDRRGQLRAGRAQRRQPPREVARPPGLDVVSERGCLGEHLRRVPEYRVHRLQVVPHPPRQPLIHRRCHDRSSPLI